MSDIDIRTAMVASRKSTVAELHQQMEPGTYRLVPADAIVIERSALPKIEPLPSPDMAGRSVFAGGIVYDLDSISPDWHRAEGLRRLAVAEYIDAHLLIDEVAVVSLTRTIIAAQNSDERVAVDVVALARALIRDGWHKDADR